VLVDAATNGTSRSPRTRATVAGSLRMSMTRSGSPAAPVFWDNPVVDAWPPAMATSSRAIARMRAVKFASE
jgi:hypothetical protein